MKTAYLLAQIAVLLAAFSAPVLGHERRPHAALSRLSASDVVAIKKLISAATRAAITIDVEGESGRYAVAGWETTDGRGAGEGLLRKSAGTWKIVVNGGGSLANVGYLEGLGVPAFNARALVRAVEQQPDHP